MADLKVTVDGKITSDIDKLQEILRKGFEKGGITPKQYTRASADVSRMKELTSKGTLNPAEVKELEKLFHSVGKAADLAAKSIVSLTTEAKAAAKRLEEAEKRLSNARRGVSDAKATKVSVAERYAQRLAQKGQTIIGSNNQPITSMGTLAKGRENLTLLNSQGKPMTPAAASQAWKYYDELIQEFRNAVEKEKELGREVDAALAERKQAKEAYNNRITEDIASGKTKDEAFTSDVVGTKASISEAIGGMQADLSEQAEQNALAQSAADIEALGNNAKASTSALGKLTKQVGLWAIGLRLAKRAISEVKSTITELDKSLTEQAMVTGKSRKEVYGLLSSYQQLAIQTGATTKEVSATVTEFVRQGKSFQEAITLAKAATSAAKVAGISSADSVNYLTTALNGFRLSAQQAMSVSDKFAAISASAATSYEEIAIALSKVASQANLAGMSIDYTTALLAKGLETTREAPETIGTALKTIIARMREITDYGETLEDGVDINNVESQLSYVGVALRTVSGELRSTEDVLNDLGAKWDTLSSNQQAAVAKALAGTRQQSRLIAMMSDYERVIELQEIAAQSSGATLAQMAVYGEGLEAALNRLSTQWEKIISTISNSDVIVGAVDFASFMLDTINNILDSAAGIYSLAVVIGVVAASTLLSKLEEHRVQKLLLKGQLEQRKKELESLRDSKAKVVLDKQDALEKKKQTIEETKQYIKRLEQEKDSAKTIEEKIAASQKLAKAQAELKQLNYDYKKDTLELKTAKSELAATNNQLALTENEIMLNSGGWLDNLNSIIPIISTIMTMMTLISGKSLKQIILTRRQTKEIKEQNKENEKGLPAAVTRGVSPAGIAGILFGIAVLAALGIAIGVAYHKQQEQTDNVLQKTSAEIFNITKNINTLQSTFDTLDAIDAKLIKSKEDAKAYADELEKVASILSSDKDSNLLDIGDMSEQEYYKSLASDSDREAFLKEWQGAANKRLDSLRQQQRDILARTGINSEIQKLTATSLIRSDIYDEINNLELSSAEKSSIREFVDSIVDEFSDEEKQAILNNGQPLSDLMSKALSTKIDGEGAVNILSDEARTIQERAQAYKTLQSSLVGIAGASRWLRDAYAGWDELTNVFSDEQLKSLDRFNIDFNKLNDLYTNFDNVAKKVKSDTKGDVIFSNLMSEETYQERMLEAVKNLDNFEGDVSAAVRTAFKGIIGTTEEFDDVWNAIFDQFGNALTVGVQNIGQSVDKLKSSITSFYSTAQKWNTMNRTEQSTFIAEHAAEFSGEQGAALLEAFETQDYDRIEEALKNNDAIRNNLDREIQQVRQELNVEESYKGAARDEGKIKVLREILAQLEADTFYQVDLETIIEQQSARINAYKELLQKEEELLTKSLEERKDAYQSYFDSINKQAEDEDYEEKAGLLTANLAKLSGSTSMTAKAQTEELQNSLAELEKERLDTLRQRAQEAVIQSIDDTITEISDSFAELLDNNREILNLLKGTSGESLVADLLSQDSFATKTAAEAQQYLNEIQSTFGSQVSGIDWSNVSVSEVGGQLTLNIGDQVIQLSGQEAQGRNIKEAILTALTQNGINGGSS